MTAALHEWSWTYLASNDHHVFADAALLQIRNATRQIINNLPPLNGYSPGHGIPPSVKYLQSLALFKYSLSLLNLNSNCNFWFLSHALYVPRMDFSKRHAAKGPSGSVLV